MTRRPETTIGQSARRAIGIPDDLGGTSGREELPGLAYMKDHLRESVDIKNTFIPDSFESFLAVLPSGVRRAIRDRFAAQFSNLIGDLATIADLRDGEFFSPLFEGLADEDFRFPGLSARDPGSWLSGASRFQTLAFGMSLMQNFGTSGDTEVLLESEAGCDFLRVKFMQVLAAHMVNSDSGIDDDGAVRLPPMARSLSEGMTPEQELDLVGSVSGTQRTRDEAFGHYPYPWSFADGSSDGEQEYREVVFPKQIDQARALASICEAALGALTPLQRTFAAFHVQLNQTVLGYRALATSLNEALVSLTDRTVRRWDSVLSALADAMTLNMSGAVRNAVAALFLSERQELAILSLNSSYEAFFHGQVAAWRTSREGYESEQRDALSLINYRLNEYYTVLSGAGSGSGGMLNWDDWTQNEFAGGGRERNVLLPTRPEIAYDNMEVHATSGAYAFSEDDPAERERVEKLIEEYRQESSVRFTQRFEYWDPYDGITEEPEGSWVPEGIEPPAREWPR